MEPIRSPRNRAVVEAGRLHRAGDRRRLGKTLIEGPNLLTEALAAGVEVERTFHLRNDPAQDRWPVATVVEPAVLARIAGTETPRGPVAVIAIPEPSAVPKDRHVLVLWGVSDPGNVGTIIRSAAAFGLGVVIGPETADPWSPKVLRAGGGGHFRLALAKADSVRDLAGLRLAATVARHGTAPASIGRGPWAVLIGSEAHGLDSTLVGAAETSITIPMCEGAESLNASVAASIVAYELAKRSGPTSSEH